MSRTIRPRGFSLVELLVVLGVIAALVSLILPAIQKIRATADKVSCTNNVRNIGLALHQYHGANGRFPPGVSYRDGKDAYPFMGWHTRLLPYIDRTSLWDESVQAFAAERFFRNNPPHRAMGTVIPLYVCPTDRQAAGPRSLGMEGGFEIVVSFTSYLGVSGATRTRLDGMLYLDSVTRFVDVFDGTSSTLMVGERPPSTDGNYGWWYGGWGQVKDGSCDSVLSAGESNVAPRYQAMCPMGPYQFGPGRADNQCDAFHFWSMHPAGGHFLFVDGSVRFLDYSVGPLFPALATRAGGEKVSIAD